MDLTAGVYIVSAYLLGAIPFGLIVVRVTTGKDPRRHGSGNIGATNARRVAGNMAGAVTLAADMAKGALPVAVAMARPGLGAAMGGAFPAAVALAAFLGHLYPVYLGFRGGKGVATAAGGIAPLAPLAVLAALGVFVLTVALARRVSAASLAAAVALPVAALATGHPPRSVTFMALMAVWIIWRHRDNIRRLLDGTEPRIGR